MKENEILKCPICKHTMVKGFIPNFKDNIAWYPYGEKWKLKLPFQMRRNSINLQNDENNSFYSIAYFCDYCKKIIIDVPVPTEVEKNKVFKGYTFDINKKI